MKAMLLGSGIATGVPTWNDGSEAALRARTRDPDLPRRRGVAPAVTADGLRYALIEAPFHLAQTRAYDARFAPAAGKRAVPIDSIVLTSADLDACAGALALRSGLAIRVASAADLRADLIDHDAAFRSLEPLWAGLKWNRPFALDRDARLEARLLPLPGPVPDHLREDATGAGRARSGVRITDLESGRRLVWAPRIEKLDSATLAELRAADVRFIDGTFYAADEGRRVRPGARSCFDLGHVPIDGRQGSLTSLAGMEGRSIYVHLSATNPIAEATSKEAIRVADAGVEIASDGQEVEV